jgi:uncharacterized CHY-type Zn-finger protein
MDDCVYFTRRSMGTGTVMAWVLREDCPKCGKARMAKPYDAKTGKYKIRAKIYVCPSCGHEVPSEEYASSLECNIKYTCPHCKAAGEARVPFKRVRFQGAPAIVFGCGKCREKIAIIELRKDKGKKAE